MFLSQTHYLKLNAYSAQQIFSTTECEVWATVSVLKPKYFMFLWWFISISITVLQEKH